LKTEKNHLPIFYGFVYFFETSRAKQFSAEQLGFLKSREFLDPLSDSQLFEEDSAPRELVDCLLDVTVRAQ
jgi:hypothetical protein